MDKKENLVKVALKYLIEGFIVAIAAYYIPAYFKTTLRKPTTNEVFAIALTASLTMFLLDTFSKDTAMGARLGTGFGIGSKLLQL